MIPQESSEEPEAEAEAMEVKFTDVEGRNEGTPTKENKELELGDHNYYDCGVEQPKTKRKRRKRFTVNQTKRRERNRPQYCAAVNCKDKCKKGGQSFFRFPREPERCERWKIYCKKDDLKDKTAEYCYMNLRMCAKHFENTMFSSEDKKNRLKHDAYPTLFDMENSPPG